MWTVAYLPDAEQERAALPKAERAALINADAKLGAYGPQLGYPQPAPCVTRTGCENCGREQAAARGGCCTGRSVRCSWWRQSGRRPSRTRAVSSGRCARHCSG